MQSAVTKLIDLNKFRITKSGSFCVGQIVKITEEGQALVNYLGNAIGPVEARSVIDTPSKPDNHGGGDVSVLLVFEDGDITLPIIVGIIHNTLYPLTSSEAVTVPMDGPRDVVLDGRKMVLDAKEEIVLRCGKSSVTLKKDGKIVVKGAQIVSQASGTNKIRGAAVRIN